MADENDSEVIPTEVVEEESNPPALSSPAKLMRIGSMIKQILEEIHNSELDEPSRDQLRGIYERSLEELDTALGDELGEELERITIDFGDEVPSEAQLRVAKAQLIGWMEGVFHGIQAALIAQQAEARQQLEGMRNEMAPRQGTPGGPGYL